MTGTAIRETVGSIDEATQKLPRLLKARITQGAFLSSEPREISDGRYVAKLGLERPQVVWDPSREEGSLSFLRYPEVSTVNLSETQSGVVLEIPSRADVLDRAETKESSLLFRVEAAILDSARHRLAKPAIVQNQLNPIREILVMVGEEGTVPKSVLSENSRYFRLLEDLRYIELDETSIRPGPATIQMLERAGEEPYLRMLGDIIAEGYEHLTTELNLQHVNSFVHTAGSYFWPSQTMGEPLEFELNDFYMSLKKVYGPRSPEKRKIFNHVQSMTEAGVFEKVEAGRRAEPEIWERFSERAPSLA